MYANGPRDNKKNEKASRQKARRLSTLFLAKYWKSNFLCGRRLLSRILLEINLPYHKLLFFH
jgi:hypothetical protein